MQNFSLVTWLRNINFIITVVIPLVALSAAIVWTDFPWAGEESLWVMVRPVFYLMMMPITAVISGIMFKEYYPKDVRGALMLFIPFLLSVGLGFATSSIFEVYDWLVLQSITDYLGLQACFVGGTAYLAGDRIGDVWRGSRKEAVQKIATLLVIFGFALIPVIFFVAQGLFLYEKLTPQFSPPIRLGLFVLGIVTMVGIYLPRLGKLHGEGKL